MNLLRRILAWLRKPQPVGSRRHPSWRKVRARHLAANPECAACGETRNVDVHHIIPVSVEPLFELDDANLITLCDETANDHHRWIGHGGNWRLWNGNVRKDAQYFREMLQRIKDST